jgi:hypothetical protein
VNVDSGKYSHPRVVTLATIDSIPNIKYLMDFIVFVLM